VSSPPVSFEGMEAQIWTLIGLLTATLVGTVFYLGNRIDSLGNRIDSLGTRLDARIDGLSARVDALADRVDNQGKQLASQIYALVAKLDDHIRYHAS
jgi:predicted PurR-regulated permease PerM